ncbi:hypothetical protein MRS76_19480 [Rhizobiaceae bacterium n13]|nr:hypothetical protein [Fererhizobium litorale]
MQSGKPFNLAEDVVWIEASRGGHDIRVRKRHRRNNDVLDLGCRRFRLLFGSRYIVSGRYNLEI